MLCTELTLSLQQPRNCLSYTTPTGHNESCPGYLIIECTMYFAPWHRCGPCSGPMNVDVSSTNILCILVHPTPSISFIVWRLLSYFRAQNKKWIVISPALPRQCYLKVLCNSNSGGSLGGTLALVLKCGARKESIRVVKIEGTCRRICSGS